MKVLVVDDVAAVRTRVAAMLGELPGVEVVFQADGSVAALRVMRAEVPHLVVLDLHLRGESGLSLAPLLKREQPSTTVVVLTNDPSEHHRRQSIAQGADFFFDKSGDFDQVVKVIAQTILRLNR